MDLRKRTILACLFLALAGALPVVRGEVVVRINDREITRQELGMSLARAMGRAALNDYVDRALVAQEARRRGVAVTPAELDARCALEFDLRVRRATRNARLAPDEFRAAAAERGVDFDETRAEVEKGLSVRAMRARLLAEKLVERDIDLSDERLREYFDRTRGRRYAMAHVMLPTERQARQALALLRQRPELWADVVQQVSMDRASVPYKGRVAPVPVDSEWGRLAEGMAAGDLKLHGDGEYWHVIRLIRAIPAEDVDFEQAKDDLKSELLAVSADERVHRLLADLNERACVVPNLAALDRVRTVLGRDVAVFVNGEPFSMADLAEALVEEAAPELLPRLIDRELMFQEAERRGVELPEEAVDAKLDEVGGLLFQARAQWLGRTAEELTDMLPSPERARDVKDTLAMQAMDRENLRAALLAERMVADEVEVTDEELRKAYEEFHGKGVVVTQVTLDTAAEAQEVLRLLEAGTDFDLLARQRAGAGGALVATDVIVNVPVSHPYYVHVQDLAEGELSAPFRYEGKYRIIKVLQRRSGADAPPLESVREKLRRRVFLRKARARIEALIVRLRAEADIEVNL